ncbi:Late embryogenesis abundant protein [Trema orientale]|uniref:Late embryogenesis abundant protein n=2 Tax=Cannabaceae TaxID=3481 RepID=A0A2P5D9X6_PARAD|nr:Late embryogenesis abundant protein [Parasponia andersonii]PON97410.1 Late embryogenesis abundant protein [Trema orientale]
MADKAHLNGAYYGPSIPPPSQPKQSYHRPGRGGIGGCCCGCLFSLIFKLIFSVVFTLGLAALIFWLIFRPVNQIKFHVTDAKLTQFNFTDNNQLHYNLAVNITVRNPNKKIGVYYDRIEARASYEGQRFDAVPLEPFYQGHKNTAVLSPVFDGQQMIVLNTEDQAEFNKEKSSGLYSIDVKLYLRIRFKLGVIKTWRMKPKIECDLKVPLSADGKSTVGSFQTTKCDWDL